MNTIPYDQYPFKLKPYKHQQDALDRSWRKADFAIFAEMGTGKSKILIDSLAFLWDASEIEAAVIVAPKGVYRNWQLTEIPKHLPDHIPVDVILWSPSTTQKQAAELKRGLDKDGRFKVLVMNVEAFSTSKGTNYAMDFLRKHGALMAVDESTTIKNGQAKRTKNCTRVGMLAKYRRVMTGSPITKSPMDLYSQCAFLDTGLLGFNSFYSFQARYCRTIRRSVGSHSFNQVVGYQNLPDLTSRLDRFSFRILKKDCLDLPEKIYIKRTVDLTDEQAVIYNRVRKQAIAELNGKQLTAQNVLTQIIRLQQICSGYFKADDGTVQTIPSSKFSELMEVLEEVQGKVVIWASYTHDLEMIRDLLAKEYGQESVRIYYGATSSDDRQQMVIDFQNPDHPLRFFVGQPRTGGYGLTLTEASTMIYFSNSYDLEIRLQSEDRCHRIGQKNSVTYVDIVTSNTVDEKILKALREKINIASEVLAEGYREWLI